MRVRRGVAPEWVGRYEALRAHATGQAPLDVVPVGLAILQHRGVAAWMAAETAVLDPVCPERASRHAEQASRAPFTTSRSELVRLLAGTALGIAHGRAR